MAKKGRDGPTGAVSSPLMLAGSLPRDVKSAIAHLRSNLHRSVPTAELAAHAGVPERTLHTHFRTFLGIAPGGYGARIRLAEARRALHQSADRRSVTEIAIRFGFLHLGRFSRQYRRIFGELPSATRRAAAAAIADARPAMVAPALDCGRPEIGIATFAAPQALSGLGELLADSIAAALAGDAAVSVVRLRTAREAAWGIAARYQIRGRIVQLGERFRITASLIDALGEAHLWGDACDGWIATPLATIDRVVAIVARAVFPNIRRAEIARVASMRTEDLNTHEICLRAYSLLARSTLDAARRALDILHRVIERDPDNGLAIALAAWGHTQLVAQLGSRLPAQDLAQAKMLAARAGVLEPDDATVLTARGMVHTHVDEHDVAAPLIERALAISPHSHWAWERSGWLKIYSGDAKGAIACFGRSLRHDAPNAARTTRLGGLAAGLIDQGDYHGALKWMRRALNAEPGAVWLHRTLAVAYARIGERQAASRSVDALRRYRPDITVGGVVAVLRFQPDFISRMANGLLDLGVPA